MKLFGKFKNNLKNTYSFTQAFLDCFSIEALKAFSKAGSTAEK